jgi:hypothetical protein
MSVSGFASFVTAMASIQRITCAAVASGRHIPTNVGLTCASCRSWLEWTIRPLHVSSSTAAKPEGHEEGKERKAAQLALAQKILPQSPTPPKRTSQELHEAERHAKEYSRRCMIELRKHQKKQNLRKKLRYAFRSNGALCIEAFNACACSLADARLWGCS